LLANSSSRARSRKLALTPRVALIKALEYLWKINAHIKANAIVVDCLNEKAKTYYLKYGFEVLSANNGRVKMFLAMKTVAKFF